MCAFLFFFIIRLSGYYNKYSCRAWVLGAAKNLHLHFWS